MGRDIGVDVDQIVLGILDDPHTVGFHFDRVLMRLRMSAKAFVTGLLCPC